MIYYEKSLYVEVLGKLAKLSLLPALGNPPWSGLMLVVSLALVPGIVHSQTVSINSEGKRVVVYQDGTWRYYQEADSVLLMNRNEVPLEAIMDESPLHNRAEKSDSPIYNYQTYLDYLKAAKSYESDLADQVDRAQEQVYEVEDAIQYSKAKNNRQLFEQKRLELKTAHARLGERQKVLGNWRKEIGRIRKIGVRGNFHKLADIGLPPKYLDMSGAVTVQPPIVQKTASQSVQMVPNAVPVNEGGYKRETQDPPKQPSSEVESFPATARLPEMTVPSAQFLMNSFRPEPDIKYDCQFAYQGLDEFTRQEKKELVEELLFTFTDDQLKPYFKKREHVTCHAYMTKISGGFRYLNLVFRIASKTARREYGLIAKNTLVNLKLMNGKTVSLYCQKGDNGMIDNLTGDTIYRATFQIDAQKERMILKSEVDKIRVVWSTGYEDYDVHNVDLLINQLRCLEAN